MKPRFISPILHRVAHYCGYSRRAAQRQAVARILMFHEVGPPEMSARAFASVLRYLSGHFRVVPLESVVAAVRGEAPVPEQAVALTFDDGLRCHATIAAPILEEFSAPATFFVNPGLIDEQRWQWAYEVEARLEFAGPDRLRALAGSMNVEAADPPMFVERMKLLPLAARLAAEETVREATRSFAPTASQRLRFDVMTWEELQSLDPARITIGSHTSNHPILRGLSTATNRSEIASSRSWLESRLQRPVLFFCYPNGDFDATALAIARETYAAAVVTDPGIVVPGDDPYTMKRLASASTTAQLAWRLHRHQS